MPTTRGARPPWPLLLLATLALWLCAGSAWASPPAEAGAPDALVDGRIAQVFSPGDLTQVHAELDSLRFCSSCHASQNKLDPTLCLSCHGVLETRIKAREGYHGSAEVRGQACQQCHVEHKGRDAETIKWPGGKPSAFPHAKTGWPLKGAHAQTKQGCESCHETRRIESAAVLATLKEHPAKKTFLGLERTCTSCHFDEHRGALGQDCTSCHSQAKWTPTPGFDHGKRWPLEGAHAKAECVACHAKEDDTKTARAAFPAPVGWDFLRFEEMPHADCTDCHKDPHNDRFGQDCTSCHTTVSWKAEMAQDNLAFHAQTRYPLEGAHRKVDCATCHPTVKGKKRLRPIPFERCTDCHASAHPELPPEEMTEGCEACHTVDGFTPAHFTADDHQQTQFPLEGAHLAVGCQECHTTALGGARIPPKPQRVKGALARQVLSPWRLATEGDVASCATCHTSPHRAQFDDQTCASCHTGATWKIGARFDHTQARFPLEGRHAEVDCALCHGVETDAVGTFVRYAPLQTGDCAPCHADVHQGQFQEIGPAMACGDCHTTEGFKALRFDHNVTAFSDFPLKGAHTTLECSGCHLPARLSPAAILTTYRPLPEACAQCHADNHGGAFRQAGTLVAGHSTAAPSAGEAPWGLPLGWTDPKADALTNCEACHIEESWRALSFNHDLTRFPLKGGHKGASCEGCHTGQAPERPPMDCATCHQDIHRGTLGADCAQCHTEQGFDQPVQMLARHAQTSFPLIGRHAVVPCTECHADMRDLGFVDAPSTCEACHMKDVPSGAGVILDHGGLTTCADCHTPLAWKEGALLDHERCFPIRPGTDHAGVSCSGCHPSAVPTVVASCDSAAVSCVNCHGCESGEHGDVRGYECQDQKCYACHPGGS